MRTAKLIWGGSLGSVVDNVHCYLGCYTPFHPVAQLQRFQRTLAANHPCLVFFFFFPVGRGSDWCVNAFIQNSYGVLPQLKSPWQFRHTLHLQSPPVASIGRMKVPSLFSAVQSWQRCCRCLGDDSLFDTFVNTQAVWLEWRVTRCPAVASMSLPSVPASSAQPTSWAPGSLRLLKEPEEYFWNSALGFHFRFLLLGSGWGFCSTIGAFLLTNQLVFAHSALVSLPWCLDFLF